MGEDEQRGGCTVCMLQINSCGNHTFTLVHYRVFAREEEKVEWRTFVSYPSQACLHAAVSAQCNLQDWVEEHGISDEYVQNEYIHTSGWRSKWQSRSKLSSAEETQKKKKEIEFWLLYLGSKNSSVAPWMERSYLTIVKERSA